MQGLGGEALHPLYNTLDRITSIPRFVRPLVAAVLSAAGEVRCLGSRSSQPAMGWLGLLC